MRVGESVFLRKDGRWEARYCKERGENGKIRYASVYGRTREDAEEKRKNALKTRDVSLLIPPSAKQTVLSEDALPEVKTRAHVEEPLDENCIHRLEEVLMQCSANVRISLALALYTGLSFAEICALQYADVDSKNKVVHVAKRLHDRRGEDSVFVACSERAVPLPRVMLPFLAGAPMPFHYILTDKPTPIATVRKGANLCHRELEHCGFTEQFTPDALSATFIRRAFEAGVNTETVAALTGVDSGFLCKKYGKYAKANLQQIENIVPCKPMDKTDQSTVKTTAVKSEPRGMNLLILGAGSQGPVVREIAEALGIFGEIAYLDDDPANTLAMDTCANYLQYLARFPIAIPSFGDCELRAMWCVRLEQAGFILPKLIHPSATVSGNVEIGAGTVIEAKVILSSGVQVGKNCIISAGSVIDKEASVGDNTHIGCACTVPKGCRVPGFSRLNSGTLYRGMSEQLV